jgi:uncharacterized cupin superfamily protein
MQAFVTKKSNSYLANQVTKLMMSSQITVTTNLPTSEISKLGIKSWPTWSCSKSKFSWHYDEKETSYFLKGKVIVTPSDANNGPPVTIQAGDLVVFPAGLSCTWDILEDIEKHYNI